MVPGAGRSPASMRPRVFPAEDLGHGFNANLHPSTTLALASMRPRVFPAEDRQSSSGSPDIRTPACRFNEAAGIPRGRHRGIPRSSRYWHEGASMRPRVFPAEDPRRRHADAETASSASMRPRVFPAEDVCRHPQSASELRPPPRFNEAAGIPRGRRAMTRRTHVWQRSTRFNEAAGIPRGRPQVLVAPGLSCMARFNEAAGIPRGRLCAHAS